MTWSYKKYNWENPFIYLTIGNKNTTAIFSILNGMVRHSDIDNCLKSALDHRVQRMSALWTKVCYRIQEKCENAASINSCRENICQKNIKGISHSSVPISKCKPNTIKNWLTQERNKVIFVRDKDKSVCLPTHSVLKCHRLLEQLVELNKIKLFRK